MVRRSGAAAYVCRDFACDAPVSDAVSLAASLDRGGRQR
jgi:hypothetical protein